MSIKLFIGTSPNGDDANAELVYEYSLRKNSTRDLDIRWMSLSKSRNSIWQGWNTNDWFTPFSGFRWAIPHICNFKEKPFIQMLI